APVPCPVLPSISRAVPDPNPGSWGCAPPLQQSHPSVTRSAGRGQFRSPPARWSSRTCPARTPRGHDRSDRPAWDTGVVTRPEEAPASAALFDRAQAVTPGGVNSPVRAFRAVGGTPRFMTSGHGAYLVDADGREYVDLVCSWGPMILGHAHPG